MSPAQSRPAWRDVILIEVYLDWDNITPVRTFARILTPTLNHDGVAPARHTCHCLVFHGAVFLFDTHAQI
jgi:hypothetical protein